MVLLSHPTGNANSRQVLLTLYERNLLAGFYTTVAWDGKSVWNRLLPLQIKKELNRRTYPGIPEELIHTAPIRELCRVLSARCGLKSLVEKPDSLFSIRRIYQHVDKMTARAVSSHPPSAVYGYEGGALDTFRAARRLGVNTIYDHPCAYGDFIIKLAQEEAELQPAFADTFPRMFVEPDWLRRKDEELELADQVVVPSSFARSTLPASIPVERIRVIPFGAPPLLANVIPRCPGSNRKLRVLYVGGLGLLKGISYLLEAIKQVESAVDLTILGSRIGTCKPLDNALRQYPWIPTAPHSEVLEAMSNHDVLVFPTLSDGFGLVILEAMSRGIAVITTPNSGGTEVIRDGKDGFIVPIRSSDSIAAKLELLAGDRDLLRSISEAALSRAQEWSWLRYRELLASTISQIGQPAKEHSCA